MQRRDDTFAPSLPHLHPSLRNRYDALVAELEHCPRPAVAVVEQFYLLQTPRPWVPSIVAAVHARNVFGDPWSPPRPASLTEIVAARPDVIVFAVPDADLYRTQIHIGRLLQNKEWNEAMTDRRLIALDGGHALHRAGPELMASLELLAWALHRPHESLRPDPARGAERVGTGWRDLAGFEVVDRAAGSTGRGDRRDTSPSTHPSTADGNRN